MAKTLYQGLATAPDAGKPLLFAFHGTGGDENQFFPLAQALVPGAGVITPRGDVSEMGAARFFRRTGEGVYDMEDLAERTQKMAAFVAVHKAEHPGAEAFAFGYSNGANILAAVAMKHPELFDRIGLLHPLVTWDPGAVPGFKGKPVLITAGERDPITPFAQSRELIDWFVAQGAEVNAEVHNGGHELRQTEVDALQKLMAVD